MRMSSSSLKISQSISSNKKSNKINRRKDGTKRFVSEEDLLTKEIITPDDVFNLNSITKGYLCCPADNIYEIEFTRFKIRDMESGTVLFEIVKSLTNSKPSQSIIQKSSDDPSSLTSSHTSNETQSPLQLPSSSSSSTNAPRAQASSFNNESNNHINDKSCTIGRFVRYNFTPDFLKLKTVGASIEFHVGSKPINSFRMIERHYFQDTLLKTFDFDFGFCIPNSINTCEHIYEFPLISSELCKYLIQFSLVCDQNYRLIN
ncbi:GMP-PDE, delta subunit-like protein [Sarcoptes scabiei]|uniref:GMP-PDE, delta subunit-like protein n=1 Tax=Sarcoptes scabiei TaxID=52283 RepID=A0A132ALB5_SARSC|nr:GMP-PDE, delta subunit-like protein [Sarcoptes scabiei]